MQFRFLGVPLVEIAHVVEVGRDELLTRFRRAELVGITLPLRRNDERADQCLLMFHVLNSAMPARPITREGRSPGRQLSYSVRGSSGTASRLNSASHSIPPARI